MTSGLAEVVELLKEAALDAAARVSQFLAALFAPWHRLPKNVFWREEPPL